MDCKRFPEAETSLISALRTDTNECVRFEAALALTRGCCCTKKTIEALTLTVSGDTKDGNPEETSPRVRAAAARALGKCAGAVSEPAGQQAEPPLENPPSGKPVAELKTEARRVLAAYYAAAGPRQNLLPGEMSVFDAYRSAEAPRAAAPVVPPPAAAPAAPQLIVPVRYEEPPVSAPVPAAVPAGRRSVWEIFQATAKPKPAPGGR